MSRFPLFLNGIDDALNRGFEERGHIDAASV